jgi:hypothetical protein
VGLFAAAEEEFEFDAEVEGGLVVHGGGALCCGKKEGVCSGGMGDEAIERDMWEP